MIGRSQEAARAPVARLRGDSPLFDLPGAIRGVPTTNLIEVPSDQPRCIPSVVVRRRLKQN